MNFTVPVQAPSPPLPRVVVVLLAALYLLAGIQHDLWKHEDAIHIGIAWGFLTDGNWLQPAIAGAPWPHTAPLYHWVAALLGGLFDRFFDFATGARLATTLFGALYLIALAGAAKNLHHEKAGRLAALLAIGTLGLLLPLHEAQPGIAGLAFAALAWWGASLNLQGRPGGAALLGIGLGLTFPAHGLAGVMMALAALPAPILRRDWKGFALAAAIAAPLALAWPWAAQQVVPTYWMQWWANEIAEATQARGWPHAQHLEYLGWATWPLWPLAVWSLWADRRSLGKHRLPLFGVFIGLVWFLSGPPRALALLPILLPLTLIATAGAERLRRGAANAFDWFGRITFSFFALLIWLGASAQAFGWPARFARQFEKLAPGHHVEYAMPMLGFCVFLTLVWLLAWGLRRASWRPALRWATGLTLFWVLLANLWLDWFDHYKSYRPVALALRAAVPMDTDCIEQQGLGAAHRAVLDYYAGIRTVEPSAARRCHFRIIVTPRDLPPPAGWQIVWQGHRASDRSKERWYLVKPVKRSGEE